MNTQFLQSEKFSLEIISKQQSLILKDDLFREIFENFPHPILILNSLRQIVYFNQALIQHFNELNNSTIIGSRPGEVFRCEYIKIDECGTTKFCHFCGAATAIAASLAGRRDIQECRITTLEGEAYDFRVWTYPKEFNGEKFTIFTLTDISNEKRTSMLERVFYHDILNTVNGLLGFLEMADSGREGKEDLIKTAINFTKILLDEINSQRLISLAESEELKPNYEEFSLNDLIEEIIFIYQKQISLKNVQVNFNTSLNQPIKTDKIILRRIIINLLKNALEASSNNSRIKIATFENGNLIIIKVKNQQVMPEYVKRQIFKRSFSTKGKGRGLGTYSIKLLTEKFLGGKVTFVSDDNFGTEFTVSIPSLN